jgi:hypothetical protein
VHHTIKHAADIQRTKRRHQHAVSDGPILLAGVLGREEAIVGPVADLIQRRANGLGESFFVADLVNQFVGAEEDARDAECGESVDRSCRGRSVGSIRD